MLEKLEIDFDKKEDELADEAVRESDIVAKSIKKMKCNNTDTGTILASFDEYTQARIRNAANISRVDVSDFINLICAAPVEIVRPILAKATSRTVFQEKLQFDTISKQSKIVSDLVDLPNSGKNALYIGARKSVDFVGHVIRNGVDYRILIAAKYTKNDGGSQDNQRNDLIDFADHAPGRNDTSNHDVIVLLADGPYYGKKRAMLGDMDFFSYIASRYADKRIVATTTEDFDINLGSLLDTFA